MAPFKRSVHQISPLGGPFRGGTALTVTGRSAASFVDLGDAKCRFGTLEVPALVTEIPEIAGNFPPPPPPATPTITTPTFAKVGEAYTPARWRLPPTAAANRSGTLHCTSPAACHLTSPGCVDDDPPPGYGAHRTSVAFEVSMDGVLFSRSGRRFTYYDMGEVQLSSVAPRGGPASGGTLLTVHGSGLGDYSSRASGEAWQGLRCLLGATAFAPGTSADDHPAGAAARCHAPPDLGARFGAVALPTEQLNIAGTGEHNVSALTVRALEMTLNGQTHGDELTTSEVSFAYYDDAGFAVSRLHPWGGPAAGGTTLAIHLAAASLHVDLGGVLCRFEAPIHERFGGRVHTRNVSLVTRAYAAPCDACEAICSTSLCGDPAHVAPRGGQTFEDAFQSNNIDPPTNGAAVERRAALDRAGWSRGTS